MKTTYLLSFFIFISTSVSIGQNYQSIISNRISYFNNQGGYIQCVRIDSVNYQSDSIFYPFSTIRESVNGCISPYEASWIGRKIILRQDGLNVFFNRRNDSIFIKTTALLNDNWDVYNLPDSIKIVGTIIDHDTMSFLGQVDSVKSIGFQVYDKNMAPIDYPLNTMVLRISKNFGFVTTFNFYLFPNTDDYSVERFEDYTLIGLSNPKIGIQNLTWFGIYDFQIGDELHVLNESNSWGEWGNYQRSYKTIVKYLSRNDYKDSIEYTYSLKRSDNLTGTDTSYYNYKSGTGKQVIRSNPEFDFLPGEPVIEDNDGHLFSFSMTNGPVLSKIQPIQTDVYWLNNDSCWYSPIIDDCLFNFEYIKGLGGPYYECDNFMDDEVTKLVYYKKGDVTWGTPLIITGIQDAEINTKINVFPNPAKDYLIVQIEEYKKPVTFEIFDMKGQNILMKKIDSKESKIEIKGLNPGIYMYRIHDNNGILKTDKLIIN